MLLVSSLEHGGAERQVVEFCRHVDRRRFEPVVCSLSHLVPLANRLPDPSRDLLIVPKRWKYDVTVVGRVAGWMRRMRIDLVHAFLFDAEMTARLAARLAGVPVVLASERNSDYRRPLLDTICQRLTRPLYDAMVANSAAGRRFNVRTLGLRADRIHVVHNGVDTDMFRPARSDELRHEWKVSASDAVVGMVASFKLQKNHGLYFRMAGRLLAAFPRTRFLCVGEPLRDNFQGAADYHAEVRGLLRGLGIEDRFMFLGRRDDMPAVYSACDVTVLTSTREGTPNVLLESMACGVPVVATAVADNAIVVPHGRGGYVVPAGDLDALVAQVGELIASPERARQMGRAAREWVSERFSSRACAEKMSDIYRRWVERKTGRCPASN